MLLYQIHTRVYYLIILEVVQQTLTVLIMEHVINLLTNLIKYVAIQNVQQIQIVYLEIFVIKKSILNDLYVYHPKSLFFCKIVVQIFYWGLRLE